MEKKKRGRSRKSEVKTVIKRRRGRPSKKSIELETIGGSFVAPIAIQRIRKTEKDFKIYQHDLSRRLTNLSSLVVALLMMGFFIGVLILIIKEGS